VIYKGKTVQQQWFPLNLAPYANWILLQLRMGGQMMKLQFIDDNKSLFHLHSQRSLMRLDYLSWTGMAIMKQQHSCIFAILLRSIYFSYLLILHMPCNLWINRFLGPSKLLIKKGLDILINGLILQ
jgi:hypothetical protein